MSPPVLRSSTICTEGATSKTCSKNFASDQVFNTINVLEKQMEKWIKNSRTPLKLYQESAAEYPIIYISLMNFQLLFLFMTKCYLRRFQVLHPESSLHI